MPVYTHLICFCLRMKLSKASLAGKISNSERNFYLSWEEFQIYIQIYTNISNKKWVLTLPHPTFLPPAYSPAVIYFGRERGWWITCNYPTVLKEKNINRKSTTCPICWLKSVLHEKKCWEQKNHNFGRGPTWDRKGLTQTSFVSAWEWNEVKLA
jgi:hypothetical protein